MFRSVRSEEFRQAVEQVVQTGKMISSALGYQKNEKARAARCSAFFVWSVPAAREHSERVI
ncbi:MAG: hypothetical protein ACLT1T_01270 [Oscillospiraceae bacterium]